MYLLKHVDFESRSRSINSEQDIPKTSKEIIAADRKKLAASVRTGTTRSQRMSWGRTECTRPNPVMGLAGFASLTLFALVLPSHLHPPFPACVPGSVSSTPAGKST